MGYEVQPKKERAILATVSLKSGGDSAANLESALEELGRLAQTAGAQVVGTITQRREKLTSQYLFGQGKLAELRQLVDAQYASVIIFDDDLTPSQQRNLEQAMDIKILDRTALILDVFGRHARTREGRLQVELAQYQYLLPRLAGQWSHLERLGGGIGTRGPGETQLESDRRMIRRKVERLDRELESLRRHRALYRRKRADSGIAVASLVGYTNAGKSTLLKALSGADISIEDKLFATLDPVTRRIRLPDGSPLLVTDTVGFIRKLSPGLVAAFRATLEELQDASIVLHVVDIASKYAAEQTQVVENILEDLNVSKKPRILVLNKADAVMSELDSQFTWSKLSSLERKWPAVLVSAERRWGLEHLLRAVGEQLEATKPSVVVSERKLETE